LGENYEDATVIFPSLQMRNCVSEKVRCSARGHCYLRKLSSSSVTSVSSGHEMVSAKFLCLKKCPSFPFKVDPLATNYLSWLSSENVFHLLNGVHWILNSGLTVLFFLDLKKYCSTSLWPPWYEIHTINTQVSSDSKGPLKGIRPGW
jgi:hypothetical protein